MNIEQIVENKSKKRIYSIFLLIIKIDLLFVILSMMNNH